MPDPKTDRFQGDWSPQSFSGSLSIAQTPTGAFQVIVDGHVYGPLERDDAWKNLKGADACLSLHCRDGRLFGMFRDGETYQTLAAFRDPPIDRIKPVCGQDSEIFGNMVGIAFVLRTMRVNGLEAPARGDRVAIEPSADRGFYRIGKIQDGVFEEFDQLCPDAENGNLNSRTFQEKGSTRSVTMWEMPGASPRLFSMVAVARDAFQRARDQAGSGSADPAELARGLGLLPFELEALLARAAYGPGDPLIVWGADDGGG